MDVKARIDKLSRALLRHQHLYYVNAEPEVSDLEYDRMFDELLMLEREFPHLAWENSPTSRIGSDLDNTFAERPHTLAVLSLDKEYTTEGLHKWMTKTAQGGGGAVGFVVEEKIDGASIVLYYRNGKLDFALTRGNGLVGNDVTENIRTIKRIPLVTDEPSEFSVRGEIFINKSDFAEYNRGFEDKYANPRNLAAGSLRNQKSSIVAHVPLNMLSYEGDFPAPSPESGHLDSHIKILSRMASLGFPVNPNLAFFSNDPDARSLVNDLFPAMTTGDIQDISEYVAERMSARDDLDYEIDGLVVKVNEIAVRQRLGATAHHPRWAMAFKFDSPVAHTVLKDIQVQIGRNGRVTPVAILEAVRVGGSVVSRATLHNQEYIDILELGIGDRVSISKRGDIIPAVDKVLEKARESPTVFKLPSDCPFCGKKIEKTGAHHFCMNRACPERIKRAIVYFAGRNQMDIDTLGEKTIDVLLDNGLIKGIADLYDFDYSRLQGLEGFKERKIENLRRSIEKSKEQPFHKVLAALGLEGLAGNTVRELIRRGFDSVEKLITAASNGDSASFADLDGFGDVTSRLIIDQFTDPENLRLIRRLRKAGLNFSEKGGPDDLPEIFQNQIWVITGTLLSFSPRQKAVEEIEVRGGRVSAGVTSKTTHLLAGASPGSKLAKARELGVQIVNEEEFRKMLE